MKFLYKFLDSYAYSSPREFCESICPSWKYQLQYLSFFLSGISGVVSYLFGFGPALAIAMLVLIIVEVRTGIKASRCEGKNFESFKFSRCILKLAFWAIIFYTIRQFENEFAHKTHLFDILAHSFFKILFLFALSFFAVEHLTSILENISVIDGKPKTALIEVVQQMWKKFTDALKGKIE